MRELETHEVIRLLLLELVSGCRHPNDVAKKLAILGIKGIRCGSSSCPIYEYLIAHGLNPRLAIGPTYVYSSGHHMELPYLIINFISRFDDYEYKELIK